MIIVFIAILLLPRELDDIILQFEPNKTALRILLFFNTNAMASDMKIAINDVKREYTI